MSNVIPFPTARIVSPSENCPRCGQPLSREELREHDCELACHYRDELLRRNGWLPDDEPPEAA